MLAQQISFTWSAGYSRPRWLPSVITEAPPAPTTGPAACGLNASGQFTAIIRYDWTSPAAAITIQINGYRATAKYMNAGGSFPVDVEVSPPQPSQTVLSGFGAEAAWVVVNPDGGSGTLSSSLVDGSRNAASIRGSWRCR